MKRNKRTMVIAHEDLTPLTEHILTQMGHEGSDIRKRLKLFYRERTISEPIPYEEPLENPI
ncbi:MAG: hypothetical protein HY790_04595 [Deltaproteobacteria bacterium]|nr:hypothetical protein [Deltaproteobacteria bacterium]MBI4795110.1 hypothetical protein [Deltaproteobacteria bacterium]